MCLGYEEARLPGETGLFVEVAERGQLLPRAIAIMRRIST